MGTHPHRRIEDPHLSHSLREINRIYGVRVDVEARAQSLHKFGHNTDVGQDETGYTVWETGADDPHETFVADLVNSIDSISSGEAGDGQVMVVQGHTSTTNSAGETVKTFVSQEVTLNGTTRVPLGTPLNRVQRAYNDGTTTLAGRVYIYENGDLTAGKPQTTTDIHLTVDPVSNQSEKAALSLASTEYLIMTHMHFGVLERTSATVEVSLQVRLQGKIFRTRETFAAGQGGADYDILPYMVFPPNCDIRLTSISSANTTEVAGSISGYYADIV